MKVRFAIHILGAVFLSLSLSPLAAPQKPPLIEKLSVVGTQRMTSQRSLIDDLVGRNFGSGFNGNKTHDIALLQRALDRRLVTSQQTPELQAMGIILGDLLAADLGMHWVVYQDHLGRSKALRYRETDNYLFPVTMISRRREVDNREPVVEIYQKAYDIVIAAQKKPAPLQ
ncbi:MAG: hypothetical protein ACJASY_003473 [Halioglobus sp.]|jgi:hypothetical protein